jgi:CSLREA domain-containing protein
MKTRALFYSLIGIALLMAVALLPDLAADPGTQTPAAFGFLFIVTSTDDHNDFVCDNDCTLREAIQAANNATGTTDTIGFSVTGTINLVAPLPAISDGLTISGPGADRLTVQRSTASNTPAFSVFNITTTGTVTVSNLTIRNGGFVLRGAGIDHENGGTLTISNCVFDGNQGDEGAAINSAGMLTVTNCVFTANDSATGGAIDNVGTATVTNCTMTGNSGGGFGGGAIYNTGTITIRNSTLAGNSARGSKSNGGGINNGGTLNIANSTISGNNALSNGGGIYVNFGVANVSNCTIASNSASTGGGVTRAGGIFNVKSSIIALNTAPSVTNPQDVNGLFASQGFNLIGKTDGSSGFPAANDLTGTAASPLDPKLGPLQDNGGPTDTRTLLSGSPAIDKGTSVTIAGTTLTTDQRGVGYARTINKGIANAADGTDIGAFELGAQIKAVSRKTHGSVGVFDVNLPLAGTKVGVECRKGGSSHVFKVILTFPVAVTVGSVSVTPDPNAPGATASVSSFSVNSKVVTVNLTGVSNAQRIVITLLGVSDGTNTNDVDVPMGILFGDTNNTGSVASNDVTLTQSKVGQIVGATNFREDVTLDGSINSTDVQTVQSKVGTKLP